MRRASILLTLVLLLAGAHALRADGSRIKDLAMVAGARDNQLAGYGLVVQAMDKAKEVGVRRFALVAEADKEK